MNDIDPLFKIIPPDPPHSPEVREFFTNNPEFSVQRSLEFLTLHYPNIDTWVVDGGVAVQQLTGKRDLVPRDIDIVCFADEMEEDFGHTNGLDPNDNRYIDVKAIKHWLIGRAMGADEQATWERIVASSRLASVDGLTFRIMHPAIIAAGKSTLARMTQRPKDISDIELLKVSPKQLDAATKLLQGINPEEQLKYLV